MYISSYPMVAAIYSSTSEKVVYRMSSNKPKSNSLFAPFQVLIIRDVSVLFVGIIIITIAENYHLERNDPDYSVFKIFFEAFSAYGTVGLSLGANGRNESFVYRFSTLSKVVMILIMLTGRHRGLPMDMDITIQLPDMDVSRRTQQLQIRKSLVEDSKGRGFSQSKNSDA
eukprot:TRINITY_DN4401_c0_g1_i14.p1 TRINITY_DN4401_c0_g1~~TRINITY_DN4401_c0_g1_i14.p1  ORF type:complete len:170 (-),score=20.25 TRINITY_DN4401_c0_g1_i14:28-537(-)